MNPISFSPSWAASDEVQSVLNYLESTHSEALTAIATAVHVAQNDIEVGACLGASEQFTRGSADSVSIPVGGRAGHPAVYVHTHPVMKWKPSETDIRSTIARGERARGFMVLTTNGLDSVFGSLVALPDDISTQLDDDANRYDLINHLRDENHFIKLSSDSPPPTDDAAVQRALDYGLLTPEEIEN